MEWIAEPVRNQIEVIHIQKDGTQFSYFEDIKKEGPSTPLSLSLREDDKELRVVPYSLEIFRNKVNKQYVLATLDEIFVGLADGKEIAYIGWFIIPNRSDYRSINQFFFREDKPIEYNLGFIRAPGFPKQLPKLLDDEILARFQEVKGMRPDAAQSLDACISYLSKSHGDCNPKNDFSIEI